MKRRILSIALGITMLVGLLPTTAMAGEADEAKWTTVVTEEGTPDYEVEGAGTGTLTEAFAVANANSEVTYVQLNGDVASTNVTKPFELESDKSMVLDMNGKSITVTCDSGTAYGIYTKRNSSLTVKGGTITAAGSSSAYGIYAYASDVTLNDTPAISGTTADILLTASNYKVVLGDNMNKPAVAYRIKSNSSYNHVFTSGAEGCDITEENFSDYFVSAEDTKEIIFDSRELKLVNKPYVWFNTGSGTTIDRICLPYGGTATQPDDPTWEGYTFAGWYADNTYTTKFDFDQTITEDTNVYAKWTFAATGAAVEDSGSLNGIYGSDLDRLIEDTLSKLSIKVTGENGASLSGLHTDDWAVKDGQDLAAAQLGDTITFVGKLTAPTATKYSQWYGRLPQWEETLTVEVQLVLGEVVKFGSYDYTTNSDGIMAYTYKAVTYGKTFDIIGYFGDKWKRTTFGDNGYETYVKVEKNVKQIAAASSNNGGDTQLGLNVAIDFDFLNNGQTLQIKYTVKNTTEEVVAFSLGSGADVQIGSDDSALITPFDDGSGYKMVSDNFSDQSAGDYAQFNFFGKGYVGVTDVTDFWYGGWRSSDATNGCYWTGNKNVAAFYGTEQSESLNEDSAASWHWDDRIGAGETKTYSILIGIGGAGSENAAQGGGLTEPTGSVTIELSEDLTSSNQLVIKLGETALIEDTHYTVDLTDPDKPVITFKEAAGLNVSSGNLTVTVTFANLGTENVTITNGIPGTGNVSTEAGAMDGVTAEGLDELAKDEGKDIVLTVREEEENAEDDEHSAINAAAGEKVVEFLDITLKDKNSGEVITGDFSEVLGISVPFDAEGKFNITVYRYHGGSAETMIKNPESGEEGFVVGEDSITIYAKKFSTYAIGYTLEGASSGDDPVIDAPSNSSRKPKYDVKYEAEDTENGSVEISRSSAAKGKTVTITVTPEEGYQLDELLILDKNGDEVEYKDNGDGTFTFVMPCGDVEIRASFAEVEKEWLMLIFTIDEKEYQKNDAELMNDVAPVIRNDRAMLPIRVVAENLGATVTWNEPEQSVTIAMGDKEIVIYVGQSFALVDGCPVELDSPAFIANDRAYLPMRFVAEILGATVIWDGVNQTVTIVG